MRDFFRDAADPDDFVGCEAAFPVIQISRGYQA